MGGPRTYQDLPEAVTDFLNDPAGIRFVESRVGAWGVGAPDVLNAIEDVVLGITPLASLPDELAKLGVPADKAKAAAVELATARLLPIAGEVGDVAGAIMGWGGDLSKVGEVKQVDLPKVTAESFVEELLRQGNVKLQSPVMQKRLEFQLVAFVKGVRDENEAAAMMARSAKVGGLDLPDAQARELLKAVKERLAFVKVDFSAKAAPSPAPAPASAPVTAEQSRPVENEEVATPAEMADAAPLDVPTEEDEQEADAIAAKHDIAPAAPSAVPVTAADQVAAAAGVTFQNEDLKKRFELAVDARLRDVRDAYETRALLEQSADKGGLGIGGPALAAAMEAIERLVAERKAPVEAAAAKQMADAIAAERKAREEKAAAEQAAERASMERRYAELTGAPVPMAAPVSAMKAAAAVRVSPATVPPSPGARPRMDDVRSAPRLAGPLDELRGLTVEQFRRLAKDPADAARKVRAKVALLEEQGYDQRIAAVKAWRESALHKLSAALAQEALETGMPVAQVAEARRAGNPGMFTPAELAAVMELNGELRF